MRLGIVGCGDIARRYADAIAREERLELLGATDLAPERAEALVADVGGRHYRSLDELLGDDAIDCVVNLTVPHAHAEVTAAALDAGKHVHTEKPLALRYDEAKKLVDLAEQRGLRLSAAPATLLGEAQQTAWKLVRDGRIGAVRVVYAEANWGRIESWHPSPQGLYAVGPLVDVGVYPITILAAMFGPVRRVRAFGALLEPDRVTRGGEAFTPAAPDFVSAVLELEAGVVARVTASFYVPPSQQRGVEFHGDAGSVWLPTWGEANSRVLVQERGGEYQQVPLVRSAYDGIDWGRALAELAAAIDEGRPHRASAELAAHVVEVLAAAETSARTGAPVTVSSSFAPPEPMDWAR